MIIFIHNSQKIRDQIQKSTKLSFVLNKFMFTPQPPDFGVYILQ
jgi:hypothetical protein